MNVTKENICPEGADPGEWGHYPFLSFLPNKAAIYIFGILRPSFNFVKVAPHPYLINSTLRLGLRSMFVLSAL